MSDVTDEELDALLATIVEKYHYDFRGYARSSLRRRTQNAMLQLHTPSIAILNELIKHDASAFTRLLPWFTIQVSDLFRDPTYFKYFRTEIVPWLATYPSRKLWVAGCSTGEEAYSFAIILKEASLLDRTLIYATDIYGASLRTAEAGIYDLDRMRTFTENYQKAGGAGQLSDHYSTGPHGAMFDGGLRERIVFADHSLATDHVFAECQVVSCRNVLIYFGQELQNRSIKLFRESLVRQGWLGLGPKETIEFTTEKDQFSNHPERWYQKDR